MGGSAILYGADDHANTMLTLKPGEWVRIIAKGHFRLDEDLLKLIRSGYPADHASARQRSKSEEPYETHWPTSVLGGSNIRTDELYFDGVTMVAKGCSPR